jgi:hypothetical protein
MARVLGVWCKKDAIMLAIADDGELVDDPHQRLQAPALLERSERLRAILDDVKRVLAEVEPDEVRVLMPETRYEASYVQMAPRVTLETLVRIAALDAGAPVEMLNRATARARLDMPKKGPFDGHIPAVISVPVGNYWTAGRNLAAAAALAEDL